jgi:integrase
MVLDCVTNCVTMKEIRLYRDRHVPRKSPYWICVFRDPAGKRVFKSTKLTDKKEAWKFCLKLQEASDNAKEGRLTEKRIREIISDIAGKPVAGFTVRGWFEHWLKIKEEKRSDKTLSRYRQVVRDFLSCLGSKAQLWLHHITSEDILAYRQSITGAGKRARTANLSVTIISAGFRAALREQKIDANPCAVIEKLDEDEDVQDRDPFTPAQVKKLFEAAEGDWKGAILFGYYTGARLSDVANMPWQGKRKFKRKTIYEGIDWQNKKVVYVARKTKKLVIVPLHPQLERELKKHQSGIGDTPIFPALAGKGTGGKAGLSGRFNAIMEKAGIQGEHMQASGGRTLSSLSFHSLRHSFVSEMANAGVAPEVRMKLAGHSNDGVHEDYTDLQLQTLRAAVAHIPSIK